MTPSSHSTSMSRMRRHRENLAAAKDATPEERREILEGVRRDARDRRQARPVPGWLAHRGGRRALATLAAVPFAAGVASAYLTPGSLPASLLQLAGAVGLLTGLLLLRRASRELTEIPDAELDEREVEDRNRALGSAYLALVAFLITGSLLAIADGLGLGLADWKPLLYGTFGTAVLLPSAAAAWRWRDLDDQT